MKKNKIKASISKAGEQPPRSSFEAYPQSERAKAANLEQLMDFAEGYAEDAMLQNNELRPTFILMNEGSVFMIRSGSFVNDEHKADFAMVAELACIANAATAYVLVAESWAHPKRENGTSNDAKQTSEMLDRQEYVSLIGESQIKEQKQKALRILRNEGKFSGFGDVISSEEDQTGSLFAHILPSIAPDKETREVAKALLKVKSVTCSKF